MTTNYENEDRPFDAARDVPSPLYSMGSPVGPSYGMDTPPTTDYRMNTPPNPFAGQSRQEAVPWPENTFQIIEKQSGKAIKLVGDQPKLEDVGSTSIFDTHWLCVKQDGYFGFQHLRTGNYLGHDGQCGMRASAPHLKAYELWTPREHPQGGYELLSPRGDHSLMILCVDGDGSSLVRRRHGITLWVFVRV